MIRLLPRHLLVALVSPVACLLLARLWGLLFRLWERLLIILRGDRRVRVVGALRLVLLALVLGVWWALARALPGVLPLAH
jgi:hypothetical protein